MSELSSGARKIGAASLVLAVLIPFATRISEIYVDPSDPGFGARDVPRMIIWLGIALSVMLLWRAWRDHDVALRQWGGALRSQKGPAIIAVVAFVYIWGVTAFQYALPTFVLLSALFWFFGSRSLRDLLIIPAVAVTLYYVVFFVLLGIYEEPGSILAYDSFGYSRVLRQAIGLQ